MKFTTIVLASILACSATSAANALTPKVNSDIAKAHMNAKRDDEVLTPPREKSPPIGAASSLVPKIGLAPKRKLASEYAACIGTDGLEADLTHHFCFEGCVLTNKADTTASDATFADNGHSHNTKCGTDGLDFIRANAFNAVLGSSSLPSGPITVAFVIKHGTDSDPVSLEFLQQQRIHVTSEPFPKAQVMAFAPDGSKREVIFPNVYSTTEFVQVVITIDGSEISMYRNGVKLTGNNAMWNKEVVAGPIGSTQIGGNGFAGTIKSVAMWNRALSSGEITSGLGPALTSAPTSAPTGNPTSNPTSQPTSDPTSAPTGNPTTNPTSQPTSDPTSAPTGAPGTTNSSGWTIDFIDVNFDFSPNSTDEIKFEYEVSTGRDIETHVYQTDCETNITDIVFNSSLSVKMAKAGAALKEKLTFGHSIDKSAIANSTQIWNGTNIEFCQIVQLILPEDADSNQPKMIIAEDKRVTSLGFDFDVDFNFTTGLGEGSTEAATDSTDVANYISAFKCNGSPFEDDGSSPLNPNDELFVCIESNSSDVEIESLDAMIITQGTETLGVVTDNLASISSITTLYFVGKTRLFVSTRVPSNVFNFDAVGASISISGSLELALAGGRKLTANVGRDLRVENEETAFALKVSLQGETAPDGYIMANSVISVASKGLAMIVVVFASAYGMMW